jgi:exonuclease III
MDQGCVNILGWNHRGLNDKVRRDAVRDLVKDTRATIVCLQETKLAVVDDAIITYTLGPSFAAGYASLPSLGTRSGMIIACSDAHFSISNIHATTSTLSATIKSRGDGSEWSITCVYGPQGFQEKLAFIDELRGL